MNPAKPTEEEISRYLKKIDHWKELGFETAGLEMLLRNNFVKFKERKLQILAGQISETSASENKDRGAGVEGQDIPGNRNIDRSDNQTDLDAGTIESIDQSTSTELPPESILSRAKDEGHDEGGKSQRSEVDTGTRDITDFSEIVEEKQDEEDPEESESDILLVGKPKREGRIRDEIVEGVIILDNVEEPEEDDRYNYYDIPAPVIVEPEPKKTAPPKSRTGRKPREPDHRKRDTLIAVGVMLLLLVAGIEILKPDFINWIDFGWSNGDNTDPGKPKISITAPTDDAIFQAGELITFTAIVDFPGGKIDNSEWDFGDLSIAKGMSAKHFYTPGSDQNYQVKFAVKVSTGETYEEKVSVRVSPMTVVLPEKKDGLAATYSLVSTVLFQDPEGINMFSDETNDISVTKVELQGTGTQEIEYDLPGEEVDDGFLQKHTVYSREVNIAQSLKGNATIEYSNIFGQNQEMNMHLSGKTDMDNTNNYDLTTNELVESELKSSLELYSELDEDTPYSMVDDITNYQDLSAPSMNIDLTEIRENRTFRLGDGEPGGMGNLHYMWSIKSIDNVIGIPAFLVDVRMDRDLLNSYGITDHTIHLWIADGKALPLKYDVKIVQQDGKELFTLTLTGTMKIPSYTPGAELISDHRCLRQFNDTSHHASRRDGIEPGLVNEFNEMDNFPAPGNDTTSFRDFTIENAMQLVSTDSSFISYVTEHHEAYSIDTRCNVTGGRTQWNITFGEKGSDSAVNFLVYDDGGVSSSAVKVSEVNLDTGDIGEILSYGGSLYVFQEHAGIRDIYFPNGKLDLTETMAGAGTRLPTLSVEAFYTGNVNNLDFGFFLSSGSTTGQASVDRMAVLNGRTGQILYIMDHLETMPTLDTALLI
ncbi:MAG: hypothetical protein QF682_09910 [Candidatus Thermoplasmatota archaeon]|jgi:hypothetical protein|nr:hypothetical protein [Candidatus Thermoplasmatota archaeon]